MTTVLGLRPDIRPLGDIAMPAPAQGTHALLDLALPLAHGPQGGIPQGYGRLVVVLRCAQLCPLHTSIALTAICANLSSSVPASRADGNGAACWADVPAGSWTVIWAGSGGIPEYLPIEISPGRVQGFAIDIP